MISHNISLISALVLQICHFVFAQHACKPRDCVDLKCYGLSKAQDGPHIIYPDRGAAQTLRISCDNSRFGGGWIVFQRRVEGGTVNFTRSWADYRNGFGDPGDETTELWLGNEHVYQLVTGFGSAQGYFEGAAYDPVSCQGLVYGFSLEDEDHHYTMRATSAIPHLCSKSDLISMANQPFRTLDRQLSAGYKDCFNTHSAGWWYYNDDPNKCYDTFLNGPHRPKGEQNEDGIFMRGFGKQLKGSVMMFRPANYKRRESSCVNPCIKETKAGCAYVPAENRHRCVCQPPLCGTDCSGPCENGGACVLDLCECALGFEGTLCNGTIEEVDDTTSIKEVVETPSIEEVEETTSIEEVDDTTSIFEGEDTPSVEEVEDTPSIEEVEETPSIEEVEETPSTDEVEETPSIEEVEETPSIEEVEDTPSTDEVEETPSIEEVEETPSIEEVEETPSIGEVVETPSIEEVEETTSIEALYETPSIIEGEEIKSTEAVQAVTLEEDVQESTLDIGVIGGVLLLFAPFVVLAVYFIVNTIRQRRAEAAAVAAAEERRALIAEEPEASDNDGVCSLL